MTANRNGFFYMLDRTDGTFLLGKPFVDKLNWAKGIDAKGYPIEIPNMEPTVQGKWVCPSLRGAANWNASTYHPDTGLFYVAALEQCSTYTSSEKTPEPMKGFLGTASEIAPAEPGQFFLRAIDPATGQRRWEYPMIGPATMWGGVMATAGGLVFFGDDDGNLVAVDARDGKHLWHYAMGQRIHASPVSFAIDGKQYVVIASSTHVFSFGLFEPSKSVALPMRAEGVFVQTTVAGLTGAQRARHGDSCPGTDTAASLLPYKCRAGRTFLCHYYKTKSPMRIRVPSVAPVSNEAGYYNVSLLPHGSYRINVRKDGFRSLAVPPSGWSSIKSQTVQVSTCSSLVAHLPWAQVDDAPPNYE